MLVQVICNMESKTVVIEHSICPWGRKYTLAIGGEVALGWRYSSFLIAESNAQMSNLRNVVRLAIES